MYNNFNRKIESIQDEPFDPDRLYLVALPDQFFTGIDDHTPLLQWAETQEYLQQDAAVPAKLLIVQVFSTLLWLQLGSFADLDKDQDGKITREDISNRCHAIFGPQIADLVVDNVLSVADLDGDGSVRPLEMMVAHYRYAVCVCVCVCVTLESFFFLSLPRTADYIYEISVNVTELGRNSSSSLLLLIRFFCRSATDLLNHSPNHEEDEALRATVLQVTGYVADDPKVDRLVEHVRKLLDTSQDGNLQRDEMRQAVGTIKRQSLLH